MAKPSLSQARRPWWQSDEIHILAVFVLAALFFYIGALSVRTFKEANYVDKPMAERDTITIVGKGKIKVTPDIGVLSAGLETVADGVAVAQKENTEKMNAFLARAKELGVADADRKTAQYTIYPKYEYTEEDGLPKQVKTGDAVMQTVELKVRNPQNLGRIMAALGEFGLNQVGSLSFTIDDEEIIKKRALALAVNDAHEKAFIVAKKSGIKLGRVTSFYEQEGFTPYFEAAQTFDMRAEMDGGPIPEPQAGTQEVEMNVTLTYELK
ncbi:MAG: SIMPL domain-containing protein [Patescibacteria group bacterium]